MKISDIADIINVSVKDPSKSGIDIFVGLEHYDIAEPVITRYGSTKMLSTAAKKFESGDVLIARRNVYLQRASVVRFSGLTSGDSIVLRVKKNLNTKDTDYDTMCQLLPFILNSINFWDYANTNSDGTMSKRLSPAMLLDYEFDLPSIKEQKVLAEKLWAAYEVKQSYLKMIEATQEMVKSQFIEEYYGEKKNLKQLRPHVMVIRGVSYKPSDIKEEGASNRTVLLRSNNIDNGRINFDDVVCVNSERVSESQVLQPGDIVMCGSNGSKKLVGKAAMMEVMPKYSCSFGAFCLGIRCKETIHPKYLSTFFQTSTYREIIESLGAGSNILNIKPNHIYDLMVPVPPMNEQKKFVSIVQQADKSEFDGFKSQFIEMFKDVSNRVTLDKVVDIKDDCRKPINDSVRSTMKNGELFPYYGATGVVDYINDYITNERLLCIAEDCGNYKAGEESSYIIVGKAWVNNHAHVVKPKDTCTIEYLHQYLKILDIMPYVSGTTRLKLTQQKLKEISVILPDKERQIEFVTITKQADKSENHCEFRKAS